MEQTNNYIPHETGAMPITHYLQKRYATQALTEEDKENLRRLERYVAFGIDSFHRPTSIAIQGWGISASKERYFNDYLHIVEEIQGSEARTKEEARAEIITSFTKNFNKKLK